MSLEGFRVGHTEDGAVVLNTGGPLAFMAPFDHTLHPDDADELAARLTASAAAAREFLRAAEREAAERAYQEVERLVSHIPLTVPPADAREAAKAILAAFDVTPKEQP